jgi:hypothetical protein
MMKEMNKRSLAAQPFSFNAYEDNYGAVMAMCETSGRKPAEELRDLLDEGISARMKRTGQGSQATAPLPGQQAQIRDDIAQLGRVLQQLVLRNQNSLRNVLSCFSVLVWQEKHNFSSYRMMISVL